MGGAGGKTRATGTNYDDEEEGERFRVEVSLQFNFYDAPCHFYLSGQMQPLLSSSSILLDQPPLPDLRYIDFERVFGWRGNLRENCLTLAAFYNQTSAEYSDGGNLTRSANDGVEVPQKWLLPPRQVFGDFGR